MKRITLVLVLLLVACVTVKAQVVSPALPVGVVRAVAKKAMEAKKKAEEAKKAVCHACGQEITHAGQHCSAKNHTGLCSPTPEQEGVVYTNANITHCPKCGEKLTIDERFHGCKHYCKQTKEEKSYCYRCGEEIVEDHQHCSATGDVALCSATPEEDDSTEVEMPATHCNKCGAKLTIDERFHGVPHTCPQANAEEKAPVCHRCGQAITEPGQHCDAIHGIGLCSATPVAKDNTEVKMPATHCDKCGAELTVDERFHGVPHTCKK